MSLNIFTLLKHLDELRVLAEQHEPDILAINETEIDTDIDDQEILIDGYHVERLDRNKFGSGVAIYMRKGIDYKVRNDLMIYDLESISVDVKIGMHKPFIVTSLCSPNHTVEYFNKLESLIANIDLEKRESILIGDTNCDFLKPTNYTAHLKRLIKTYSLTQLIKEPTRTTHTTQTIIDHIITNRPERVYESGVIPCGTSDHDLIFMTKKIRSPKSKFAPRIINIRNQKRFDLRAFQHDILNNIPFDEIKATCKDANEIWLQWKTFFLDILDKHMPNTQIKIKGNRILYVNSDVKQMIRQRDYPRAKANKTGSNILRQAHCHLRNKVNHTLKQLRKNYYTNKIEENKDNLKKTWQVMREAMGQGGKISSVDKVIDDGITVTDKEQIPDIFNDHCICRQ